MAAEAGGLRLMSTNGEKQSRGALKELTGDERLRRAG
jgi:hypothetical protein